MANDVNANVFVTLAQAKAWLKMSNSAVLASPVPTTTGATVANGGLFKVGMQITWMTAAGVVKERSVIQTVTANALVWAPAFSVPPAAGDLITEGTRDDQLIIFLNSLTDSLERTTGRVFVPKQLTERFTGGNIDFYPTDYAPIQSLDQLTVDGITYIENTQFVVDYRRGMIKLTRGYLFSATQVGNCSVKYTPGYSPIPSDATGVILHTMKIQYDAWATGGISVNTLNIGGFGLSVVQDWPKPVQRMILGLTDTRRQMFAKGL